MLVVEIKTALAPAATLGGAELYVARRQEITERVPEILSSNAAAAFETLYQDSEDFDYFDFANNGKLEIWLVATWRALFNTDDQAAVTAAINSLPLPELAREAAWKLSAIANEEIYAAKAAKAAKRSTNAQPDSAATDSPAPTPQPRAL